jgi:Ca2+-binding RTX toxin-like protein
MTQPAGPHRSLELEQLEERTLLSSGVYTTLRGGVLTVTGTDGPDTIELRQTPAGVTLDVGREHRVYVGVSRIEVFGRGGNDKIYVDTTAIAKTRIRPVDAFVDGGTGNDTIVTGAGNDTVLGGAGADTISTGGGNDRIDGGDGPDRLYGGDGNDTIVGGRGDDLVSGGAGNDYVDGGAGNDWVYGGTGNDSVFGGTGNDYCDGGAGNDEVHGGDGDDWVIGGAGNDKLYGDNGNDRLDGGPGVDVFDGGPGFDIYHNEINDLIAQFDKSDVKDIKQGEAGTCVLLASLLAVTNSGVDLAARIRQVGRNTYSVPLFRPGTGWIRQTVYFDGTWTDNDPMLAAPGEAWVLIYQRAYLQEMGVRWSDPNTGEWTKRYGDDYQRADAALLALTGQARWTGNGGHWSSADVATIQKALHGHHPVVALTKGSYVERYGLIDGHAYAVLGVRGNQVTLRNPWGFDGPIRQGADDGIFTVSWAAFKAGMMGYTIA